MRYLINIDLEISLLIIFVAQLEAFCKKYAFFFMTNNLNQ